jgi:hypothetical protein
MGENKLAGQLVEVYKREVSSQFAISKNFWEWWASHKFKSITDLGVPDDAHLKQKITKSMLLEGKSGAYEYYTASFILSKSDNFFESTKENFLPNQLIGITALFFSFLGQSGTVLLYQPKLEQSTSIPFVKRSEGTNGKPKFSVSESEVNISIFQRSIILEKTAKSKNDVSRLIATCIKSACANLSTEEKKSQFTKYDKKMKVVQGVLKGQASTDPTIDVTGLDLTLLEEKALTKESESEKEDREKEQLEISLGTASYQIQSLKQQLAERNSRIVSLEEAVRSLTEKEVSPVVPKTPEPVEPPTKGDTRLLEEQIEELKGDLISRERERITSNKTINEQRDRIKQLTNYSVTLKKAFKSIDKGKRYTSREVVAMLISAKALTGTAEVYLSSSITNKDSPDTSLIILQNVQKEKMKKERQSVSVSPEIDLSKKEKIASESMNKGKK